MPSACGYERVQDFEEVRNDPQAAYAQVFHRAQVGDTEATAVNHPIRYDGQPPAYKGHPLRPGQHTREVLGELGYAKDEIDDLIDRGTVAAA